jgi:hypothetical protein
MVWGHEEIETERSVRGYSPACSQSLGRRLDRAATARSFPTAIRPLVVTSAGPPVEGRGKMASLHLGECPHASREAWGMVVGHGGNGDQALFSRWGKAGGGGGALRCSYFYSKECSRGGGRFGS